MSWPTHRSANRVYREEITAFPGLVVPKGSVTDHRAHVKPAVIHYLHRLADGS